MPTNKGAKCNYIKSKIVVVEPVLINRTLKHASDITLAGRLYNDLLAMVFIAKDNSMILYEALRDGQIIIHPNISFRTVEYKYFLHI